MEIVLIEVSVSIQCPRVFKVGMLCQIESFGCDQVVNVVVLVDQCNRCRQALTAIVVQLLLQYTIVIIQFL